MKTTIFSIIILIIISLNVNAQNASEIAKKSSDIVDIGNMEMQSTININDGKGNKRVRQIINASKRFGNVNKMIMRFTAPADVKGTAFLVYDYDTETDNMWIYMPALRKVRRVVTSEKGKNFMGSEFTNADMSKPNFADFDYKLIGTEKFNGIDCYKIEAKCKTPAIASEYGFSKRVSWIDKSNNLCYKVEYYGADDKLQRVQTISDYRKLSNGKYFAYKMKMDNIRNGRSSEMSIDKFQAGSQLSESAFAPVNLDK